MRRLSLVLQDQQRIKSMWDGYSIGSVRQHTELLTPATATGPGSKRLEVNVIFTGKPATAAALKSAQSLANGLGACIRLRAVIAVPFRLSLDQPPVSVRFMEQLLCNLVGQPEEDGIEHTIHLYVCRDQTGTILQVLKPNSLVVVGGRTRWWPTAESRMARILRAKGHRVIFIDVKGQSARRLP